MDLLRHVLALATLAVVPLAMTVAETPKTTSAAKKKSTAGKRKSATASKKTGAGRPGTTASASTKKGPTTARRTTATTRKRTTTTKGRTTTTTRPPSHPRQMQPTPERYKEIQQALATKGYLKSEPNGAWDQQSMEAMRRFQEDQNISASGKIDSLSLIALGLGPKRGISATPPSGGAEAKPETQPPAAN